MSTLSNKKNSYARKHLWIFCKSTFQSIDDVYWTEDAADEDMMNTYCWMYGHLNLPHDYMVVIMITMRMMMMVTVMMMMMMMRRMMMMVMPMVI